MGDWVSEEVIYPVQVGGTVLLRCHHEAEVQVLKDGRMQNICSGTKALVIARDV